MANSERKLWVLEWFHKDYGWMPLEGESERKYMFRRMKTAREKSPKDEFRVRAYVPRDEEF